MSSDENGQPMSMARFDVLEELQIQFQGLTLEIDNVSTEISLEEIATNHLEFYYELRNLQVKIKFLLHKYYIKNGICILRE